MSVAVPTVDHHAVGRLSLELGRDVLLEKPMTTTLAEADDLMALAASRGAVLQVGHIERFNPATEVLLSAGKGPASWRYTAWARSRRGASTWTSSWT